MTKNFFIKKIIFWGSILTSIFLILMLQYHSSVIDDLRYQQKNWEIEKYQILIELDSLNKQLNKFHEYLKKQGIDPLYEKILKEPSSSNASEVLNQQLNFKFESLLFLNKSKFALTIDQILKSLKIRLSMNMKDFANLTQKIKKDFFGQIPSIWPTEGKITSLFGERIHPITKNKKFHRGVDIANLKSTDIVATATGKVIFSGINHGYGNTVILDHENGFTTLYGHANKLLVSKGDFIQMGTVIAKMGSTGISTGPHLHYEIRFQGEILDPVTFTN